MTTETNLITELNSMKVANLTGTTKLGTPFLVSVINRSLDPIERLFDMLDPGSALKKPIEVAVFVGKETVDYLTSHDPAKFQTKVDLKMHSVAAYSEADGVAAAEKIKAQLEDTETELSVMTEDDAKTLLDVLEADARGTGGLN